MPQVGTPNYGSEQNAKYLNEGLDAIAAGIVKGGENRRADEKQKWLQEMEEQKFEQQKLQDALANQERARNYELLNRKFNYQKDQDLINNLNKTRDYMLRRDAYNLSRDNYNLAKAKQEHDILRQDTQDSWLQKVYDKYIGANDPVDTEYESLKQELSNIPPWQLEILLRQ